MPYAIILRSPHQSIAIENALLDAGIGWRVEGLESYLLRTEILMLRGVAFALEDYESIPGVEKRFQVLQALELWQELSWGTRRQNDLKTAAAQPDLFDAFLKGRLLRPQTRADKAAADLSGEAEMQAAHRMLDVIARLRREGRHDEANAVLRQQHDDAQTIDESPSQRHARMRLEKALAVLRASPADEPAHVGLQRTATILDLKGVAQRLFIDPSTANTVAKSVEGFIDAARRIGLPCGSLHSGCARRRKNPPNCANTRPCCYARSKPPKATSSTLSCCRGWNLSAGRLGPHRGEQPFLRRHYPDAGRTHPLRSGGTRKREPIRDRTAHRQGDRARSQPARRPAHGIRADRALAPRRP